MLLTCKKVAIFTVTRVYELFLQLFHVKALHSYLAAGTISPLEMNFFLLLFFYLTLLSN